MGFLKSTFGPSGIKTSVKTLRSTFSWTDASIPATVTFTCSAKEPREITELYYKLTMQQDSQNANSSNSNTKSTETVTVIEGSYSFPHVLQPGEKVTEDLVITLASESAAEAGLSAPISKLIGFAHSMTQSRNEMYTLSVAPKIEGRKGLSFRGTGIRSQLL